MRVAQRLLRFLGCGSIRESWGLWTESLDSLPQKTVSNPQKKLREHLPGKVLLSSTPLPATDRFRANFMGVSAALRAVPRCWDPHRQMPQDGVGHLARVVPQVGTKQKFVVEATEPNSKVSFPKLSGNDHQPYSIYLAYASWLKRMPVEACTKHKQEDCGRVSTLEALSARLQEHVLKPAIWPAKTWQKASLPQSAPSIECDATLRLHEYKHVCTTCAAGHAKQT